MLASYDRERIILFGIANYGLFLICSESNTINIYNKPYIIHIFQKITTKITTKTWLAKVAAILTHRTSFFQRISPLAHYTFYYKAEVIF